MKEVKLVVELDQFKYTLNGYTEPLKEASGSKDGTSKHSEGSPDDSLYAGKCGFGSVA